MPPAITSASHHIAIGQNAGNSLSGGQYNTYLGHGVGYSNPGDCNIGIGYNTLNGNAACFNKNASLKV